MTQRKVQLRDAGHGALDELDAADIPSLSATYDAQGAAAAAQSAAIAAAATDATTKANAAQAASWPATTAFDATAPTTQAFGDAAAAGSAAKAAHRDHLHGMPASPSVPVGGTPAIVLGTANTAGTSPNFLRRDDTILAFDGTVAAAVGTAATGAATVAARRDHVHPTGAGTPSTQAFGDAAATGTGPAAAMTDHKHAMPAALVGTINFVIDGGGLVIATGVKGDIVIDFACTINAVKLIADQSGSVVVNIWKHSYVLDTPPVVGDKITASAPPTLSSHQSSLDSTLTGWTTSIAAGDTLRFNVDSATSVQRVTVSLKVTRT